MAGTEATLVFYYFSPAVPAAFIHIHFAEYLYLLQNIWSKKPSKTSLLTLNLDFTAKD